MAEVSFGPQDGAAAPPTIDVQATVIPQTQPAASAEAPPPNPITAIATRPDASVAQNSFVLGDSVPDFKDIILPRLNIAQALGEIGKTFEVGTIVFGQNLALWTPPLFDKKTGNPIRQAGPPLVICCLGFRPTRYVEKVQGGGGMIVNSEDEVRANGGTLDYNEWKLKKAAGMRRFEYLVDAVVAVKRPDFIPDDGKTFVFPIGTDKYALGLWALKGAAYTAAAKGFFNTQRRIGCLMKGFPTFHVFLTTRMKPFTTPEGGAGEAWVPVCLPAYESSPEFLEFAKGVLSSK